MPDTQTTTATPALSAQAKRSRPPGEMGGHTVMPWEQGESEEATTHVPAGSNPVTTASGGSSKNVPPPTEGSGDGLGQGSGQSTVKAADSTMGMGKGAEPSTSARPPVGSAGAPAKPVVVSKPMELEQAHPEAMEPRPQPTSAKVLAGDAPSDAMAGAPASARLATPSMSKHDPERQAEGSPGNSAAAVAKASAPGSAPVEAAPGNQAGSTAGDSAAQEGKQKEEAPPGQRVAHDPHTGAPLAGGRPMMAGGRSAPMAAPGQAASATEQSKPASTPTQAAAPSKATARAADTANLQATAAKPQAPAVPSAEAQRPATQASHSLAQAEHGALAEALTAELRELLQRALLDATSKVLAGSDPQESLPGKPT
jgi:hypothetical protein